MTTSIRTLGSAVLLCLVPIVVGAEKDEDVLRGAGVALDADGLLKFFRSRTVGTEELKEIARRIEQLGATSFAVRQRASEALKKRGPAAVPFLKEALGSKDPEVVKRAEECLAEVKRPGPGLALAAARMLAGKPHPQAVAVLVGYAPHVDDDDVEEAVLDALLKLASTNKPDPALVAALSDAHPARRAAAGYLLGRRADQQVAVRKLLSDASGKVRFRAVQGLLAGRDRAAVAALPPLLTDLPLALAWQIEELLVRLAGETAPSVSLGSGDDEAKKRSRAAWEQWAGKHAEKADLARADDVRRLLGLTLAVEYDTARLSECGPDGTIRWQIDKLKGPMEAWVLPGNRLLIADGNDVTERDFKGNVLKTFEVGGSGPTGCQRLPNGNTFVSTYERVMEFDREGKKLYEHQIGGSNAIRKHKNGNIIYTLEAFIIEMDVSGKKVRSIPIPRLNMWVGVEDVGNDRFVVANSTSGRVIEVDASGKILWEGNVAGACGVTRLPGGNTLVGTQGRIVELDKGGKIVWEKKTPGYVRRVHRR